MAVDWEKFPEVYNQSDTHWYVSKTKEYDPGSFEKMRQGLDLLRRWFVSTDSLDASSKSNFAKFFSLEIADIEMGHLPWDKKAQLYFTYILAMENVITDANQPPRIRQAYNMVYEQIMDGQTYDDLRRQHGAELLVDISANARNFISWYKKMGFAWVQEGRVVTVTSTGEQFLDQSRAMSEVIQKQLIKWQVNNPTIRLNRYREVKVFPFLFLLRLLLRLDPPQVSKQEYSLFVTKARSMSELPQVCELILLCRALSEPEQTRLIENVRNKSSRTPRTLFEELTDSAGKEIGFFTSAEPLKETRIGRSNGIVLANKALAEDLIRQIREPVFIDFKNELDWFSYYGDWSKGPTVDAAIAYYAGVGETELAKQVVEQQPAPRQAAEEKLRIALAEKEVENWFKGNLAELEEGLTLVGQQYPTEIGRIDLLTKSTVAEYVVIEFKRDQSSDETVGQILRYMGWVHVNLAQRQRVRGFIVAKEIDESTRYALIGMQHPSNPIKPLEYMPKLFVKPVVVS